MAKGENNRSQQGATGELWQENLNAVLEKKVQFQWVAARIFYEGKVETDIYSIYSNSYLQ